MIDTAANRVTAELPVADQPYSVAIAPDGSTVYVTDMGSNSVLALDAATLRKVATIPVGGVPGVVAVTPDGSQAWVGNIFTGDIYFRRSVLRRTSHT